MHVESLARGARGATLLRQMRARVQELRQTGVPVVLESRTDRRLFPRIDGSELVLDALLVPSRGFSEGQLAQHCLPLSQEDRVLISKKADGWPLIAQQLLEVASSGGDVRAEATARRQIALEGAVSDASAGLLAWFEKEASIEADLQYPYDDVPPNLVVELLALGLAKTSPDRELVLLFPGFRRPEVEQARARAAIGLLRAPEEWREAAAMLFEIERGMRLALLPAVTRGAAIVAKLDELARSALADEYAANTRKRIPAWRKLQYVDLSGLFILLDLARSQGALSGPPGKVMELLQREVVSIRNRVLHMRLPDDGDVERLKKHRLTVARLST